MRNGGSTAEGSQPEALDGVTSENPTSMETPTQLTAGQERDRAARVRAELMEASNRHESLQAQKIVDEFMVEARALDLPAVDLRARTLDGHLVKTGLRGWYIRNDHTVAIGVDGHYYQLTVPGGFMARFCGVTVEPSAPMLTVGRGGKDGESGDLKDFLARTLHGEVL